MMIDLKALSKRGHLVINQPAGVGDIIFCEPLFRGLDCSWMVEPCFLGMQKHTDIPLIGKGKNYYKFDSKEVREVEAGIISIPLRWSDRILGVPYRLCMASKYWLFGQDWALSRSAEWKRDYVAEKSLKAHLGNPRGYTVVNRTFKTEQTGRTRIPRIPNELVFREIEGYTILDWCGVLEGADEIHTVDTALVHIMNWLGLTGTIYDRAGEGLTVNRVDYLFKKSWKYGKTI